MRWPGRIALGAIAAAAVAGVVIALMPKPVAVDVAQVTRGPFRQTVEDDGKTRVRDRYTVASPIAGMVSKIPLDAGDAVGTGDVLAVVTSSPAPALDIRTRQQLEQRLGAAEAARSRSAAAVDRAKAVLAQAKADLERTQALVDKGAVPRSRLERDDLAFKVAGRDLDAAEFEFQLAQHEEELARAALQKTSGEAGGEVEQLEIRSPVAGRILRVFQESPGPVQIGTPLLELADPTDLEVVVDMLTTDAVQIGAGAPATIERWGGGPPLDAKVRRVEPGAFTKVSALGVDEQRVNVVLDFVAPKERWSSLGDGYRIDARITIFSLDDAIKVPTAALFREGETWEVFVVTNGVAGKRALDLIRRTDLEAAVAKGVEPGETVIVYPSDAVHDGVRVESRVAPNTK